MRMTQWDTIIKLSPVFRLRTAPPATLVQLYSKQLEISAAKKKDLMQLCETGTIPVVVQHGHVHLPAVSERVVQDN